MIEKVVRFLKDWTLPVSMVAGALGYFVCAGLPLSEEAQQWSYVVTSRYIQPLFLFAMLFLSFSKVDPRDLRPKRWHMWLLLIQAACIVVCSLLGLAAKEGAIPGVGYNYGVKILCEGAMLCFICPTATASSVITGKLGGSISGVTSYLLLCNMMVALLAPALLTMVEPHVGLDFLTSFFMIMGKVFPLLICPLMLAWVVRFLMPELHRKILGYTDLAFYIWAVSLALAIAVTVRAIVHTTVEVWYILGLSVVSLVCCVFQFVVGKHLGSRYDTPPSRKHRITSGQAFGQKNTVFIIWLGLVFLDPVTSVVGGLYSVWHNIVNSYQLYKAQHPSVVRGKTTVVVLFLAAVLTTSCGESNQQRMPEGFQPEVMLQITPVKDQGKSELCWVFAMLATIETEHLMQGDSVNISTDYLARKILEEQAMERFRSKGEKKITMRGVGPMTITLLRRYGAIPYDAYSPNIPVNYRVLSRRVEKAVDLALSQRKDEEKCREAVERILDETIGYLPMFCFMYGCQYTFKEFAHSVCGKDEYMSVTSLSNHLYGEEIVLPFKDNLYQCRAMNIAPDELVESIEQSLRNNHPVMWEGGPDDNHAVCIIGMGSDKSGKEYFVAKNSWGTGDDNDGMLYVTKKYVASNTSVATMKTTFSTP